KAAVKLHTLLDLRGNIPTFIRITDGTVYEVNVLDLLIPEAGAFYVMDRSFLDFQRLARFDQAGACFVTRAKTNMTFRRKSGVNVDKGTGLRCDQRIGLTGYYSRHAYPEALRRIRFKDPDTGKTLVFITHHFGLPALTVCQIYRLRWQVELFFKWIKQHLHIKTFYGTTENAVKTQIWSAVCVYVLVTIVRKRLQLEAFMHEILQVLSLTLFEQTPLDQLLTLNPRMPNNPEISNQMNLFD